MSRKSGTGGFREWLSLLEVTIFVGLLYVIYIAPYNYINGRAEGWDYPAAIVGFAFWGGALWAFTKLVA